MIEISTANILFYAYFTYTYTTYKFNTRETKFDEIS